MTARLDGFADLPQHWAQHPFVAGDSWRWQDPWLWATDDALLICGTGRLAPAGGRDRSLLVIGDPGAAAELLSNRAQDALAEASPRAVSLTRGTWEMLPSALRHRLDVPREAHWDWMWTEAEPGDVPQEAEVGELAVPEHLAAIVALQGAALPGTHFTVDRPGARWYGWFEPGGELRAVGGAADFTHAVHMGSIATHPAWRGKGLGTAVTAALTRIGVRRFGRASLGMYADNDGARRLYERLGFTVGMEVESHHAV